MSNPRKAIVEALATRSDLWVFRGSLVTAAWIAPRPRRAADIDLVARPGVSREAGEAALKRVLGVRDSTPLWPDSAFPGVRVDRHGVQVDLAFGDPLVPPPVTVEVCGVPVAAAPPEAMIAWKLHGLFELESLSWRAKDLSDLFDLLAFDPRPEVLSNAIEVAFASRDAPLRLTDRLMRQTLGRSAGSRKKWRRYRAECPERCAGDDLPTVVDAIASALEPVLAPLRAAEPDPTPFAVGLTLDEVQQAIEDEPHFRRYDHGVLRVFTYEGHPDIPDPDRAITHHEHRRRQVLRECRGLTFHADGRLLSRKLHRFGGFGVPLPEGAPLAIEKIDGTLISPLLEEGRLRLVTRRGPSELADRASTLLTERSRAELVALLEAGRSPILEWTDPTHRIVLAHAAARLTLIAVRDHHDGTYADWDETCAIAARAGLDVPRCAGRIEDPEGFAAQVRAQSDGEGWVLRWDCGVWMKLKTDRYRRLHAVVEGDQRERGLWRAVLNGDGDAAIDVLAGRGIDGRASVNALRNGLGALIARVRAEVEGRSEDPEARKALAARIRDASPPYRRMVFRAWDGADPAEVVPEVLRHTTWREARALVGL